MLCIFCIKDREPSCEHVFPLAIGGTVTTDRVCKPCNDVLGSRVDAALCDFFPIRMRRAELELAGNNKKVPTWYEMFLGEAKLLGHAADRVVTRINPETGKLETWQLHHAVDVVEPNGQKARHITIDARNKDQLPKIIQRERRRHGLLPLSDEQLTDVMNSLQTTTIEQPVISRQLKISFAFLRHAMFKIAYELAFLWLGEDYLADPLAIRIREAICNPDLSATDDLTAFVGTAEECTVINNIWKPHKEHHLAHASVSMNQVLVVCVRIFDIYAAVIVVSEDPALYLKDKADRAKLRFIVIDAARGLEINTSFDEESFRIARLMSERSCLPPFDDPLT